MHVEVRLTPAARPERRELESYLRPVYTGSEQGSIEQLESQLEVTTQALANLLARMVKSKLLSFDDALSICGRHSAYRAYKDGHVRLVEDP